MPRGLHAFPAFTDPHVHLRTPGREGRGGHRLGHPRAGRRRWLLARSSRWPKHRPGGRLGLDPANRCRSGGRAARGSRAGRLHRDDHARAWGGQGPDRDVGPGGGPAPRRFTDDGLPVASAGGPCARALQYQRLGGPRGWRCTREEPSLSRKGAMHEGVVSAPARRRRASRRCPSRIMVPARLAPWRPTRGGRIHIQHLSRRARRST